MANSYQPLLGKSALVTGAGGGIGKATVLKLAEAGADILMCDKKTDSLQGLADEVKSKGRKAVWAGTDMGVMEDVNRLVEKAKADFGVVDILVNCAAVSPFFGPMLQHDEKLWDKIMSVNLKGPYFLSLGIAKLSIDNKKPCNIINVASAGGMRPDPMLAIYAVSKAGMIHMTRMMATELGPFGIRCNSISPSFIRTRFSQPIWGVPEILDMAVKQIPLGRIGEPDEVAKVVVFLASDESSYVNCENIVVTGGMYAG
ncbi:MAG: SDR family oxidoreductase [Dehalococcoidia bacterium]|nr:SDR family oxidoreductase [Dehalococcoidia bacterium]